jgi:hypothetical protein
MVNPLWVVNANLVRVDPLMPAVDYAVHRTATIARRLTTLQALDVSIRGISGGCVVIPVLVVVAIYVCVTHVVALLVVLVSPVNREGQ